MNPDPGYLYDNIGQHVYSCLFIHMTLIVETDVKQLFFYSLALSDFQLIIRISNFDEVRGYVEGRRSRNETSHKVSNLLKLVLV